jgi:transcriptional regulator
MIGSEDVSMYQPPHFVIDDPAEKHALIAAHPLGLLITREEGCPCANTIPFFHVDDGTEHGVLHAHVARANPLWKLHPRDEKVLVIFQGAQSYISPSLYAGKAEHHKVVPTWNYALVEALGTLVVHDDLSFLRPQLERLTRQQEKGRAVPWDVSDAPDDFIAQQMKAIVGIEIKIERLTGKFKLSQNRVEADRAGVVAGLKDDGEPNATAMAEQVERFSPKKA